ncbi:MAG: glycosyltransferase [Candidatus Fermentibacteraceae bacterium]|nr:glycosyltransferase [Candidatus Fermentibacteraceae bacterium]
MEKETVRISVVVPAHNGGDTIERVLTALKRGLEGEDELIVVDDRSTDGTAVLAAGLGARVIPSAGKPGAAGARNTGAAAAAGGWVLFVDSDAVAPHGWRERLMEAIQKGADGVQAVYDRETVGDDAATFYKNFYYHYTFTRRIKGEYITGCGTFFFAVRRELFTELGGFDENIPGATVEDADFAARLVSGGGRIRIARDLEVLHLRRYTFGQLMRYEWIMMVSKVLYLFRRDGNHGSPSVSMARPLEMVPVLLGAVAVWPLLAGLVLAAAGFVPGAGAALMGLMLIAAGHLGFWKAAVANGGWRGFSAVWITFPDLALVIPALLFGLVSHLAGRKY